MRIVSGRARGRRIEAPSGRVVRPTTDRVREALFSSLADAVRAEHLLDLFAGSGALGLESLSRGAERAQFVEKSSKVAAVLRQNIEICGFEAQSELLVLDASAALRVLARRAARFDLVFLDPPYEGPLLERCLDELVALELLAPGATIVAEHPAGVMPRLPLGLRALRTKRYGGTEITFLERDETVSGTPEESGEIE